MCQQEGVGVGTKLKARILAVVLGVTGAFGGLVVSAPAVRADDGPGAGLCVRLVHELEVVNILFLNILPKVSVLDPVRASLFGHAPTC